MEFEPHDQDIIRLLTRLKDVHGEYPESMFVAQRQLFLNRMAEIEVGLGGKKAGKHAAKGTPPRGPSLTISTFMEIAILAAILAEAGIMAYFYRDTLANFFHAFTTISRANETTPAPAVPTSAAIQGVSPSPAVPSTAVTVSLTETPRPLTNTPINTSIPGVVDENSNTTPGIDSTPVPNGNNNGNNGHHYGQTPKPARTKENGGNNVKPTKDKPPKEKPTKSK